MTWGTHIGHRPTRRTSVAALRHAARQTVEALEARTFLHAGEDLEPTATGPYNGQQSVGQTANVTVTFATALNTATVNANTVQLRDPSGAIIPATVTYNATTKTLTLDPTPTLAKTNDYYTATVKGGAAGVADASGHLLDADLTFAFTTGTAQFTQKSLFAGALTQPTAIQFAPDGRVFVAEKSGIIKVFASVDATAYTVFADLRTQVHNFWDRGLLGMALHPDFATHPYVYVLYAFDADVGGTAPKYGTPDTDSDAGPDATGQGAKISGRLSRLTASGNTMVPGSELVLINDWRQQFPSHSVGTLAFGPDGALYASAGDGANFSYADYGQTGNPFNDPTNEGGALRAQDVRSTGDPTGLSGTIIRIDPDTGAALPDNPLYATGNDDNAKRIIAYGFRNPFRITFRPGTSEIWAGDVGWNTWEEINRITVSSTTASNYGWPAYEGAAKQPGYAALNLPLLQSLYDAGPGAVVTPYYAYQHSEKVVSGSAEPTGGSSISGVSFYTGASYPAAYQDALFFADYARQAVYVMYRGVDGLPDPSTRQVFKLGIAITQLSTGPNGDLFAVDNTGKVYRFTFTSTANRPPTAAATADKTSGAAPLTVKFSAAGSTDPDSTDTLSYAWDLNGDGRFDDSTAVSPTYAYATAGTYAVRVQVTDTRGLTDTASVTISAGNTAPVPVITSPATTLTWKVGDVISFAGYASDQQDGTVAASGLHWQVVLRHENATAPGTYHEHIVQEFQGVSSGSFVAPDHEYPSSLELRLTATDAGGLTATKSTVLLPKTAVLTFVSNVAGATLSFNGEAVSGTFSRTVIVGSASSVVAVTPQTVNGVLYNFAGWSDGGGATHNVIAAAAGGTYTATFAAAATVPVPWQSADVGSVGKTGSTAYDAATGTFSVAGAGADIWGTSDSFRYVYQQVTGDATVVARVKSIQNTNGSAKAGLQFRQSLDPAAANVQVDVEGDGDWGEFHARSAAGGSTATQSYVGVATPYYMKLERKGNLFSAYQSADGQAWALVAQATVAMTGPVYVGLAVCSHDVAALNTSLFDKVTVTTSSANLAPTIAAAAQATVAAAGTTAALIVLGADDAGEPTLTYTWSQVSGPGVTTFGVNNGLNAGKALTAAFAKAGTYVLRATARDAGGLTVAGEVTVTVAQVLTTVTVTPATTTVAAGATLAFAAVARDQFGDALAAQPAFAWALDAGGIGAVSAAGLYTAPATVGGSATVRATAGGKSAAGTVTVTAASTDVTAGLVDRWAFSEGTGTTTTDAAGSRAGTLKNGATWTTGKSGTGVALDGTDDYVATGGTDLSATLGGTATLTAWMKTTQVGQDLYWQAPGLAGVEEHWGDNDVFWGTLDAAGRVSVRAGDDDPATSTSAVNDGQWHFVALSRDAGTGQLRVYVDGALQGTAAGAVGAKTTPFSSLGRIAATTGEVNSFQGALDDVRVYDRVLTSAEVLAVRDNAGPASPPTSPVSPPPPPVVVNAAPTVASVAKLVPTGPVAGTAAALTVLGADDGPEATLTYTWSVVAAPTGAATPTFSASGTNAAKSASVTFAAAGAYTLRCTISDGSLAATTDVSATVLAAAFTSAKINFQPAAAPTISGYLVDAGDVYTPRTNGLTYGWNASQSANVFDRAKNADQRLDTVVRLTAGAKWEIAVPSGTYSVKLSVGDALSAATNTVRVEGVSTYANTATAANAFRTTTVSVKVTDGKLTIDNGSAAAGATALNYVEITRTGA